MGRVLLWRNRNRQLKDCLEEKVTKKLYWHWKTWAVIQILSVKSWKKVIINQEEIKEQSQPAKLTKIETVPMNIETNTI